MVDDDSGVVENEMADFEMKSLDLVSDDKLDRSDLIRLLELLSREEDAEEEEEQDDFVLDDDDDDRDDDDWDEIFVDLNRRLFSSNPCGA